MPEDTLAEKRQTDKVPYDLWVQQNGLRQHLVRSLIMNISKHILEIWKKIINLRLKKYVRIWNATQFMQDMEAEGYTMIEIRQGMATLSGPTKDFREQVYQKKVIHNNNL